MPGTAALPYTSECCNTRHNQPQAPPIILLPTPAKNAPTTGSATDTPHDNNLAVTLHQAPAEAPQAAINLR